MSNHKNVHFRDGSSEKSPSPKRFQEPEGMTNIDLRSVIIENEDIPAKKQSEKFDPRRIRKKLIQAFVILAFLLFGTVTFLSFMPDREINSWKKSLTYIFAHNTKNQTSSETEDLSKLIAMYNTKFFRCKLTRQFEDCCAIFTEIDQNMVIRDCNVDAVINTILKNENDLSYDYPFPLPDTRSNDSVENRNAEILDYNYDDADHYNYGPKLNVNNLNQNEQNQFHTSVHVSEMNRPVVENNNVRFGTENTSLLLASLLRDSGKKVKRSPEYIPADYILINTNPNNYHHNNYPNHYINSNTNMLPPKSSGLLQNRDHEYGHGHYPKQNTDNMWNSANNPVDLTWNRNNPTISHTQNIPADDYFSSQQINHEVYRNYPGHNIYPNINLPPNPHINLNNRYVVQNQQRPLEILSSIPSSNINQNLAPLPQNHYIVSNHAILNKAVPNKDASSIFKSATKDLIGRIFNTTKSSASVASPEKYVFFQQGNSNEASNDNAEKYVETTVKTEKTIKNVENKTEGNDLLGTVTETNHQQIIKLVESEDFKPLTVPQDSFNEINYSEEEGTNLNVNDARIKVDDMLRVLDESTAAEDLPARRVPDLKAEDDHKLRTNDAQNNFQTKSKISQFSSATEDLQTSQHTLINPNFNQRPCVATYTPPVATTYPLVQQQFPYGYGPNPRYGQFLPITRSPTNSYVINPQYTYVNPPQMLSTVNQPYATGYNTIYGAQNMASATPIQVAGPGGQYYICNPVPTLTNQLAGIPGVEVRQSFEPFNLQGLLESSLENEELSNQTRSSDKCSFGEKSCADGKKCIKISRICDGEVNCDDASDEIFCSCKHRVGPDRLCDGYFDCPNGEDELECFGCEPESFSCDDWTPDRSATCISMEERCDGIAQCPTGKDEDDCSVLTETIGGHMQLYKISNTMGFLHRNYKGRWYPTCSNPEIFSLEVCQSEAGPSNLPPLTHMIATHTKYKGPYINALPEGEIEVVDSCVHGHAVFVECPQPACGMRLVVKNPYRPDEFDTSAENLMAQLRQKRSNGTQHILGDSRVVGGKPSRPAAWPWIVTIYRNGVFHCGGVLISESWIVTAAHCVEKYTQYYYEIEAGILRRFSYSPMQQSRFVTYVVAHDGFDRANLRNDLALMKLSAPVKYNRYVRPICLPTEFTAGKSFMNGPVTGTLCTAVGWGATVEHGADPDNLREVEVPVLSHCKHKEDEAGQDICAGLMEGGRDACQGDSGGPFMCRNPNNPNQWYLAGIVSHGEGCARPNEPGVYTRVSLYLNWIYEHARNDILPNRKPLHKCPGFTCKATRKCIPKKRHCDRIVDCLLGDDEMHCQRNNIANLFKHAMRHMILVGSTQNSTDTDQKGTATLNAFNKLEAAEITTEITSTTADQSTLITDEEVAPEVTSRTDSIFGTTFKMENKPITDNLNRNGFGFTVDDTSFATSLTISDQNKFISNEEVAISTSTDIISFNSEATESTTELYLTTDFTNTPAHTSAEEIGTTVNNFPETTLHNLTIYGVQKITADKVKNFLCKKMLEVIPISKKCNKIVDCQDATDEENCTCRDYLRSFYPEGICDGITDCYDSTDENDCGSCKTNEFRCQMSNTCMAIDKKCDNVPDCPFNEDEWDCFALTDGYALTLDVDLRPHLNTKGILTFFHKGSWIPMCANWTNTESEIASDVCLTLGFADYRRYVQLPIKNRPLKIIDGFNITHDVGVSNVDVMCNALYVKCSNTTITTHEIGTQDKFNVANELYTAPWNAAIYADGEYKCMGTLLNLNWVLTSFNCFPGILKLRHHYVAVLFGSGKGYLKVAGPHEQIRLVVESIAVLYSDVVLLRLEKSVTFTRHVRPLHFIKKNSAVRTKEICAAIGKNSNNKLETVYLNPIKNCTSGSRCFKRIDAPIKNCEFQLENDPNFVCLNDHIFEQNDSDKSCIAQIIVTWFWHGDDDYVYEDIVPDNEDRFSEKNFKPWTGTIVCDSGNGFYPAAVFSEKYGECGFVRISSFTTVSLLKRNIFQIMEQPAFIVDPQECKGFRCSLGQCIESKRICDRIPDCRDAADENESFCSVRREACHLTGKCGCDKSEMKCANGRCVPKTTYCNREDDCGDDSDEPDRCNCVSYLKLVDPGKICDGIRNCHDRSDELPHICRCNGGKFKCGNSGYCIPDEMVCDGTPDCPSQEDEQQCLSLKSTNDNIQAGEVMTRTAGVWHAGCFPEHLTTTELETICKELGFASNSASYMNKIYEIRNETAGIPVFDPFTLIRFPRRGNVRVKLAMRSGNQPFVSFEDHPSCFRLFIECL